MRALARGTSRGRGVVVALVIAVVLAACTTPSGSSSRPATRSAGGVVAQVATFQIVANKPQRLMVALISDDNRWLSFGSVGMSFAYIGPAASGGSMGGRATASGSVAPTVENATASFLPIPGSPADGGSKPMLTAPADGHGLYAVEAIRFPAAGYWQLVASGTMADGTALKADAAFEVRAAPVVIDVGQPAQRTDNPVIGTRGVPDAAIDSRAVVDGKIPDPELHKVSIADAIAAHHPALVVFSTPVYCVSQFCGPVTDMIGTLAKTYTDRADFIHVEIYRDFNGNQLNQAAIDWLRTPQGDLREPWTFLIGADGRIAASWDTVVTRAEIEPLLKKLPRLKR
jgi:hypothetical protein